MMKKSLILIMLASTLIINGQERCGTELYTDLLKERYSEYDIAREKVNKQTNRWIMNHPEHIEKTIIIVPVVVHVVWNTNSENISDAQIFSQMVRENNKKFNI